MFCGPCTGAANGVGKANLLSKRLQCERHADASVQARIRTGYEFMKTKKIGECTASFFVQWATFEARNGQRQAAEDVLNLGQEKGATPASDITAAMEELRSTGEIRSRPWLEQRTEAATPAAACAMGTRKSVSGPETSKPAIEPLPDYIKSFNFKKMMQDRKAPKHRQPLRRLGLGR